MNFADEKTWKNVRIWIAIVGGLVIYVVGFGLTAVFYAAHLAPEKLLENDPEFAAAIFWPLTLPIGMALWYPWQTLGGAILVFGCVVVVVVHFRGKHLQAAIDARLLDEAGL